MKALLSMLALAAILLVANATRAQEPEYVGGELLIQVEPNEDVTAIVRTLAVELGEATALRIQREVSTHMRVWLVEFDEDQISEEQLLYRLRHTKGIAEAQYNHVTQLRATTPNDPQFGQQWQYINTGQNGGVVGADLDADLAWDITTGGLTALGDTIVVCIIDNGIDFGHEDWGDNLWVNHNEIPDNNIDDDNNGFVDDYVGWNADNNNDNVTNGNHGTSVAGIVGAKGNNGIGVSGINWDVKLMIVDGGGDEAQAIAAYSYPLALRKQWNETNGMLGAFVVATNASWGTNFGQPADAPLWCAMYDSLGTYGILNCGATINGDEDVDVVGDLPTACPSDFLISVTNMNSSDVKVNQAGYGATTIDIGAFGEDTWTTDGGNSYDGFGGTSGATPHVTGTIGLLYSAPCPNLLAYAAAAPDSVALLMKEFIYDGSDPNASLNGITVTGKRLNINGALQELLQFDCAGTGCFTAFGLNAINVTDVGADLTWNALSTAQSFDIEWRPLAASSWQTLSDTGTTVSLSGLTACTEYVFRVRVLCDTSNANFSSEFHFTTDGCCTYPTNVAVANVSDSTADVSWDGVLAAVTYNLRYRTVPAGTWVEEIGITANSFAIDGLVSCQVYEVEVATTCDTGTTAYSPLVDFFTTGCEGCLAPYCETAGGNATDEWIENVTLGSLNNTSGSDGGFGDFTGVVQTILYTDSSYTIEVTPGYSGFSFGEAFTAWIDWNKDGDFDDADEQILDASDNTTVSNSFSVPLSADTGTTRMRVAMRFNSSAQPCDQSWNFGEAEDYCIAVQWGVPDVVEYRRLATQLHIYPNPGNGLFSVRNAMQEACSYSVIDLTGRTVAQGKLNIGTNQLNLVTLPAGVYWLQAQSHQGPIALPLVVQ